MFVIRRACTMLLLAMAACSSSNSHDTGAWPQRAAMPPADYVHIGSADVSQSNKIQIGVNTDLLGDDEAARLSLHFGLHFPNSVREAKAEDLGTTGDGLSVKSPIVFSPPATADAEVQNAVNLIGHRAPDRRHLVGRLFRSPDRRYLLLIEFDTAAGANALYFDITNWAKNRTQS